MADIDTSAEEDDGDEEAEQREADEQLLDQCLTRLIEHFDAVQIFVSRPTRGAPDETSMLSEGRGNYYTRRGMAEDWVCRQRAE